MFRASCAWFIAALVCFASAANAQTALTIVNAGPRGEVANLAQANEIRIVFSEPMVVLGRIPSRVTAPFVQISPSIPGTFRWSGTTILIFTPDPRRPLPFATTYQVMVAPSARAVSGRTLGSAYRFQFTTPTVKLLETNWYRRGGSASGRMVVLMRFNQPVRARDVAASLTAALEPHAWTPPAFSPAEVARLKIVDPGAIDRFNAKVAAVHAVAGSRAAVRLRTTNDWDKKRFPAARDLVAFDVEDAIQPESHITLTLAPTLRSPAGRATPGRAQAFTIAAERAFFVDGFDCRSACDGDRRNPIELRTTARTADFARALTVADLTTTERPIARARAAAGGGVRDQSRRFVLEDGGYAAQPPNTTYAARLGADFRSADGQTLGYTWVGISDTWHMRAFTSFGDGHGVWEKDGGAVLPFYARNMRDILQWLQPVPPSGLMPLLRRLQSNYFSDAPAAAGTARRLGGAPDRVLSHGIDLGPSLRAGGTGLVWAAIREGEPIPRARLFGDSERNRTKSTIVQVTNLGITVKDSPQNTLIFVTRLDTGAPVAGAAVSIVRTDNTTFWRGTTGADGVALAPDTRLRGRMWWEFSFIVIAEKDGDVAYVGSDWDEGISPWDFGTGIDLFEADPLLRGSVFTDRGVYRLGEEVHLKAILRHNRPDGIRLLPPGSRVFVRVRDSQNRVVDERIVSVNAWSSAEWTLPLPEQGSLGNYSLFAMLEADRPKPLTPETRPRDQMEPSPESDEWELHRKGVHGSFLVAAYRRPDFRVDVSLSGAALAGETLNGSVLARYLFGAAMGARPVTWKYSRAPVNNAPAAVTEKFIPDQWIFVGWSERDDGPRTGELRRDEATLTRTGTLGLELDTVRDAGVPLMYSLEADVEDVSRQHIANRASMTVHPAPWYVGVRRPDYFLQQAAGLQTALVAVGLDGAPVAGVPIEITLTQIQWTSVRRAEGNGFYTWDTERKDIEAGAWKVVSAATPVPLHIPFTSGGYFQLEARGVGSDGRFAVTRTGFYVLGAGYTAWRRFDHNRIELVPERQTYKPGDTARIMIQSPWEQATALVTTEREGIRSHRQFALTSTQQSIDVPIADTDIPNLFVSVLLVKGRTVPAASAADAAAKPDTDVSDPGKPSFRLGYVELNVEDRSKRLNVAVTPDKAEYRPASKANVRVQVTDQQGRGTASEVTLWAVDYGVLSLTSYRTPDVLGSVYVRKALQVMNNDSRQRIISRRVLTPKGETEGGDGGGAGADLRRDFRVLAFWLGSVPTDASGRASIDVTLPESLTTYRVMAVASDRSSRFGGGDAEVRTNKPLTLRPAFPRFLAVGDRAFFGAVVGSQLATPGEAVITIQSLDPGVMAIAGPAEQRVQVAPGGNVEARFEAMGRAIGRARVRMTVTIGTETDAFEDVIPVEVLASPETVAAYGEASGGTTVARETLTIPAGVVPGYGGLSVEVASTALVGLAAGAQYLVEYPYGCAEQRGSRALALVLAADLGDAFSLPGVNTKEMRPAAQAAMKELERYQCADGGFAYWPGACWSRSPYLTAYLLNVFKIAADHKYQVDSGMRDHAYSYLERELAAPPPVNEGWWPAYTAWQAFAVKVLVEGGRNQDSNITRLYGYRDRMPIFGLAYLYDAMVAKRETGARLADLRRRLSNAILPEAGTAHVEELSDPYLLWFWNSNVRSTAIVLNSLMNGGGTDAPYRQLVTWLMQARKNGRWGNTQENAHAMQALVNYYRRFEPDVPNFRAVVQLGQRELAEATFRGRTTESTKSDLPMSGVLAAGAPGTSLPLTFSREGPGTLYYSTRLRYAVDAVQQDGLDAGFIIERRYEPFAESGTRPASLSYKAGDLVRVTLTLRLTKERRYVAVTDPLAAGFEAVESWFNTTSGDLRAQQDRQRNTREGVDTESEWDAMWRFGGFDHVERHDDRVLLFATRLGEGTHEFSYVVRATTAGTFKTAPAHAEEMYTPEIFGRTATTIIEVRR